MEEQLLPARKWHVGGWLLFFCVYLVLSDILFLYFHPFTTEPNTVLGYVQVAVELITVVCIVTRKTQSFWLVLVVFGLDLASATFEMAKFLFLPVPKPALASDTVDPFWIWCGFLFQLGWVFCWFFYFRYSLRVERTLGRNLWDLHYESEGLPVN